jgi:Ca2+-binding RTX toxin-like protein
METSVLRTALRSGALIASFIVMSAWVGTSVPASAATPADVVSVSGSTLLAQACCSKTQFGFVDNDITISGSGTLTVSDTAGVTAGAGCVQVDATHVSCDATAVTKVRVSGGNGSDDVHMNANLPSVLNGGPGFDNLYGGPADDILRGGSRSDVLDGGPGADLMIGGNGTDPTAVTTNDPETVSYASRTTPIHVTNDGVANDGAAGEHDNVAADISRIIGGTAADTISLSETLGPGSYAKPQEIFSLQGGDTDTLVYGLVQSGPGSDTVTSIGLPGASVSTSIVTEGGNDTIQARNGTIDYVQCGAGQDTATLDRHALDSATDCEVVVRP